MKDKEERASKYVATNNESFDLAFGITARRTRGNPSDRATGRCKCSIDRALNSLWGNHRKFHRR